MSMTNPRDESASLLVKDEAKEISMDEALKALLNDTELSDFVLKSSIDGTRISTNRCILAARSPVFRGMLFGSFSEATKSVVDVAYPGNVIQALVEYIYTNDCEIFRRSQTEEDEGGDMDDTDDGSDKNVKTREYNRHLVPTLVWLTDAANFFAFPQLRQKTESLSSKLMETNPSLAAAFWVESARHGPNSEGVSRLALKVIRLNPEALLQGETLAMLNSNQVREILQDDKLKAYESTRFAILLKWANADNLAMISSGGDAPITDAAEGELAISNTNIGGRKRKAQLLTEHIRLEYIDPLELSTTVASSGLVTSDQLSHAYKEQALAAHQNQGVSYKKSRLTPTWKSSDSVVYDCTSDRCTVELLSCMEMTVGNKYQWSILLEVSCDKRRHEDNWLGVANIKDKKLDCNQFLGEQPCGWVYGDDGYAVHNLDHPRSYESKGGFPIYGVGSKVTFYLDLTRESGGILCASVNGDSMAKLFDDILGRRNYSAGDEDGEEEVDYGPLSEVGFVPAVSMTKPGRVRFLGFETPVPPTPAAAPSPPQPPVEEEAEAET